MKATGKEEALYPHVISSIIRSCRFESYLELGIGYGSCLRHIISVCQDTSITAVDLKPYPGYQNGIPEGRVKWFVNCSTDDYFAGNQDKFDAIFIDADHSSRQVTLDFENSIQRINSDGIIFLHDTYPPNESYLAHDQCSDSYRAYLALCGRPDLEVVTLPTYCGLTIVRPVNPNQRLLTLPPKS